MQARLKSLQPQRTIPTTNYGEKQNTAALTESYLMPNIHYMYTAHCSITQDRYTRNNSPPSKLKAPRCEHWESAPVPTSSHPPVPLPLAAPTPQQWLPHRCCTTPTNGNRKRPFPILLPSFSCLCCTKFLIFSERSNLAFLTGCFLNAGAH